MDNAGAGCMHVRADAVCIGDSRTDGVRFGDARPGRTAAMPAIRHPRRTRPARCERNESCRCVKAAGVNAAQLPLRIPCADWIPSRLHGPSAAGMPGKSAKGEKTSRPLVNRANGC